MSLIEERYETNSGCHMDPVLHMMILDIVNKLSRLAISPEHIDTVHDIAGYATLYEKYLRGLK